MFYARIKYSRQPIPTEYAFPYEVDAVRFAIAKKEHNPYVRWTEIDTKRKYPNHPLGNLEKGFGIKI